MPTSWTFYLERPCQQIRNKIGLFQDNELAVFKNTTGPQAEKIRKQITKPFKENGLKTTIQCNLKSADYLDATLNLTNVPFQPYRKLNDEPPYTKSNHPPTVINISKYPKLSIADYHPTKKHSTSLRQSTQIKWIQRKPSLLKNTKKKHKRTNEKK